MMISARDASASENGISTSKGRGCAPTCAVGFSGVTLLCQSLACVTLQCHSLVPHLVSQSDSCDTNCIDIVLATSRECLSENLKKWVSRDIQWRIITTRAPVGANNDHYYDVGANNQYYFDFTPPILKVTLMPTHCLHLSCKREISGVLYQCKWVCACLVSNGGDFWDVCFTSGALPRLAERAEDHVWACLCLCLPPPLQHHPSAGTGTESRRPSLPSAASPSKALYKSRHQCLRHKQTGLDSFLGRIQKWGKSNLMRLYPVTLNETLTPSLL